MEDAKEVCSLFLVPTFVEPIYNKNPGALLWDGRSVFRYQLLHLELKRLVENGGIESNGFPNWVVECWYYRDEMGNDRRDKWRFIPKAWNPRREEVVPN
jgi:hypothetical protein